MQLVRDWMTANPATVPREAPLSRCVVELESHSCRYLPVLDGEGRLAGVVNDAAVYRHGYMTGGRWRPQPGHQPTCALEIAIDEPTCQPDDALMLAFREMLDAHSEVAVVVDGDGKPVGVLTEHDGVRAALEVIRSDLPVAPEATADVVTIGIDTPIAAALRQMEEHGFRHLVVVEDSAAVGVVSWRDLVERGAGRGGTHAVLDLIREQELLSVSSDASLLAAAKLMVDNRIGCVPVLAKQGRVRGVVTRHDILDATIAALETEALFP